jgi:hypothetical protein
VSITHSKTWGDVMKLVAEQQSTEKFEQTKLSSTLISMKNGFFKKSWATFRLANIISIIIIIIV